MRRFSTIFCEAPASRTARVAPAIAAKNMKTVKSISGKRASGAVLSIADIAFLALFVSFATTASAPDSVDTPYKATETSLCLSFAVDVGVDAIMWDNMIGYNEGLAQLLDDTQRMAERKAQQTGRPKVMVYAKYSYCAGPVWDERH